jgi:prepilin-type N-terminal cleavage/methylation domain-containing protein
MTRRKVSVMGRSASRIRGLTLLELMITMLLSSLVMLAVGIVLLDSTKGFRVMYERAQSPVVSDAYATRAAFDTTVRKSSIRECIVGGAGGSLEVYYYSDTAVADLDRYARFYLSGTEVRVDYGSLQAGTLTALAPTATLTLARNVTSCSFAEAGISASMHLVLTRGQDSMTVDCTAVRHNI